MTDAERITLKEKILSELAKVAKDIVTLEEVTKPEAAEDMDDITRMDSIVNKSVNSAALSTSRNRQAALEYALKRIATENFGYCAECGEEIPIARLMAMPQTVYCLDCAQ